MLLNLTVMMTVCVQVAITGSCTFIELFELLGLAFDM